MIEVKPLQRPKQFAPNEVTEEGMVIEVKLLQPQKHQSPKEVTEEGMVIEVKPLQPPKQQYPKEVTEEGMMIEVKRLQPEKQEPPKEVTEEGMMIEVKPLQPSKHLSPNEVTLYSTPSLLLTFSGTTISPEYPPFVLAIREADFVPGSKRKRRPSITSNLASCAIALLAVMSIMTTKNIKLLKELWADRLSPVRPFLNVENIISQYFIKQQYLIQIPDCKYNNKT